MRIQVYEEDIQDIENYLMVYDIPNPEEKAREIATRVEAEDYGLDKVNIPFLEAMINYLYENRK